MEPLAQIVIGLLIVVAIAGLYTVTVQMRWKKLLTDYERTRAYSEHELSGKHPQEIRDMLVRTRELQSINHAYLSAKGLYAADRDQAEAIAEESKQLICALRSALDTTVENRASEGLATPTHQ